MRRQAQARNLEIPGSSLPRRPGMTVFDGRKYGPSLTEPPFLPRTRLLAGRFSARVAFRDPWSFPSALRVGPVEEPGEPPGIRPRPARPAPQRKTLRLRRAAARQTEA